MDLGCLEKHNFSTALLENSRKHHGIAVNSHKAHHSGLFPDWLSLPIAVLNGFKVVIFAATTKLVVTVIRFYFVVKIFSYKENVRKYFMQISFYNEKFSFVGWLPATHKHFPNCYS